MLYYLCILYLKAKQPLLEKIIKPITRAMQNFFLVAVIVNFLFNQNISFPTNNGYYV